MTLSVVDFIAQDTSGNALNGADVTVRKGWTAGSGDLADIYTDAAGTTSASNPITASADGTVRFYVQPGKYNLTADGAADSVLIDPAPALIGKQYETRADFVADSGYTPNDGVVVSAGGLLYVRDSTATVISDLPGWAPFGDSATPEHFGAIGDGVADDTSDFSSFVSVGGGYLQDARYLSDSGVLLPENGILRGQSKELSTLIRADDGTMVSSVEDGLYLSDMTIDGQRSSLGALVGGHMASFSGNDITIADAVFKDYGTRDDETGGGTGALFTSGRSARIRLRDSDFFPDPDTPINIGWMFANKDTSFAYSLYAKDVRSGIGYAHELKNYSYHNNLWGLTSETSRIALAYGQQTPDDRGSDFNIAASVLAKHTDGAVLFGKAWYNLVNGVLHDKTKQQGLALPATADLASGSSFNALHAMITIGDADRHIQTNGDSNYFQIAIHGTGDVARFRPGAAKNFVEVTHPGSRTDVRSEIDDSSGNGIGTSNANVVHSPATGERIGSINGKFWDKLGESGVGALFSAHNWVYESSQYAINAMLTPGNSGDLSGISINTARDGLNEGRFWHVTGATKSDNYWTLAVGGATDVIRVYQDRLEATSFAGEGVQSGPEDATVGRLMKNGAHGLGATDAVRITNDVNNNIPNGLYYALGAANTFKGGNGHLVNLNLDDTNEFKAQIAVQQGIAPAMGFRTKHSGVWGGWNEIHHTGNTIVDGSGFIKEASPIVRIYTDSMDEPNKPVGAALAHDAPGVYVLSDVEPLAAEGWQVDTPSDVNGNKVLTVSPPEYDAATRTLTLRTHDLLWHEGRLVPGDPMDIPAGYFVMLRFQEPAPAKQLA